MGREGGQGIEQKTTMLANKSVACVAGVKRGGGRGNLSARGRVVSCPNSLPLPLSNAYHAG